MTEFSHPTHEQVLQQREAIVRKGMRLQIATELLAARVASRGNAGSTDVDTALRLADELIGANEAMP